MQYNGGKTRIAKHIAPIVNADRAGRVCWEPFCGGLGMTEHLLPDVASDVHPGLIALYEKLRVEPGWLDGFECSEADYKYAKTLPDSDPVKAFIGFGCSFGGKWFGGYARGSNNGGDYAGLAAKTLKRKLSAVSARFACGSFFEVEPRAGLLIYCDPPYAGTTGYAAAGSFDSRAFFARCLEWSAQGSIVYISEYTSPIGVCVWSRSSKNTLAAGVQGGKEHVERLFRVAA